MSEKLKFKDNEAAKLEHKIKKTEANADKYGKKCDKYKEKQPTRKKLAKKRLFDKGSGKAKTRLHFEKETIPINEAKWNNPKPTTVRGKTMQTGKSFGRSMHSAAVTQIHAKVYEVEHENAGTQSAHRAELIGESAYRGGKMAVLSSYRFVRNTPYRRAAKFEAKAIKTRTKLEYQKALRDDPKLRSNPISRFWQKQSIKKQYAAAYRSAKKSGKVAKSTASVTKKAGQVVVGLVRKNPILLVKLGILLLLVLAILALFTTCAALFSGGSGFVGATSYAAEEEDINQAELSYSEWETDMLLEVENAETTHSDYDEYRYNIGAVGHSPLELMAYLTAVYEDFIYSDIVGALREIFNEQYQLEFISEIEIRTRTETRTRTRTDPETGETWTETYEVEVQYEWHILNVILTSQAFSTVIYPKMDDDQYEHFMLLMHSRGNRQYVGNPFGFDVLPYVTSYFGYRVHPISGAKDYHKGLDIGLPEGTEILAGIDGTVTSAAFDGGYGNCIVIKATLKDGSVIEAKYAHCHTLLADVGQNVKTGDVIATVGNTGNSTGAHLHVEVVKNGIYLNPIYFMVTN